MVSTIIDSKVQIGQLLVQRGAVTEDQVQEALNCQQDDEHRKLLGEILVELNHCTEDDVVSAIAECYGVPYAKVNPKLCDAKVLDALPYTFMEDHLALPVFRVNNVLTVAVSEPANLFLIDEIEQITGYKVQLVCTTAKDIISTLRAYSPTANVFVSNECIEENGLEDFELVEQSIRDESDLKEAGSQASVVELVNHLLRDSVKEKASDIHIEPDDQWLRVRYRVDGKLYEKARPPHQMYEAIISRIKMMAEMDVAQRKRPQEGTIRVLVEERTVTMRVSVLPGNCGEKVTIRLVDPKRQLFNLESLGFTMDNLQRFRKTLQSSQGLILLTGPAGSGKNSTLHAAISEVNQQHLNICTVEDPLVCNISGVNQFEVSHWQDSSFRECLRFVLQQNPDVLIASQLPDKESAETVVRAALSGTLVLSTLHTADAASGIRRLIDLKVSNYLVSDAVVGVLSQRLANKICSHCKEKVEITASMNKVLERLEEPLDMYYRGKGCSHCRDTGVSGRIALHELLILDTDLRCLIHDGIQDVGLRHYIKKMGMPSMIDDGLEKVRAGIVSLDELMRAVPFDH